MGAGTPVSTTTCLDERIVAEVWERQAFDESLTVTLGLQVVYRGTPSDAGGPDYQDAILSWNGRQLQRGDIEFHVRSSDWYRHGHQRDPRYNGVLLHVVWIDDASESVAADGHRIPVLALGGAVPKAQPGPGAPRQEALLPHPCIEEFARISTPELRRRVCRAGLERFDERASRLAADLSCCPPDQVVYAALFEALGYASNRQSFRQLADVVPIAWLQSIPADARLAALLAAAGLGPMSSVPPPGHLPADAWRLTGIRPSNHPGRRIRGIAALLESAGPNLAGRLERLVLDAATPARLGHALRVTQADEALIGAGRADEMVVSVVLPFVAALDPDAFAPRNLYASHRAPPSNRWTRLMKDLFAQAGHDFEVRTAVEHQGLHHLYHTYCRPQRRERCPVCATHRAPTAPYRTSRGRP